MPRRKRRRGASQKNSSVASTERGIREWEADSQMHRREGKQQAGPATARRGERSRSPPRRKEEEKKEGRWPEWRQVTQQAADLLVGQPRTSGDREAMTAGGGDFRPERERVNRIRFCV